MNTKGKILKSSIEYTQQFVLKMSNIYFIQVLIAMNLTLYSK